MSQTRQFVKPLGQRTLVSEAAFEGDRINYDEVLSGISTNKGAVLNTKADTVFLIVGIGEIKHPSKAKIANR